MRRLEHEAWFCHVAIHFVLCEEAGSEKDTDKITAFLAERLQPDTSCEW